MTEICVAGSGVSVAEVILWSTMFVCIVAVIPVVIWSVNRWVR